jgi:uncharacterized membrane protein YbhN (UPF0104 family)
VSRKQLFFALQMAVTVCLLFLLFRAFDWSEFLRLLRQLPLAFYVWSFLTILAGQVLYALRWHIALRAVGLPVRFAVSLQQSLVGVFFNNFLPSTMGGDSAKVYYLGREEGYARVTASVIVDRGLGVAFVATLAVTLASQAEGASSAFASARRVLTGTWTAVVAALLIVATVPSGVWLRGVSRRWPRALPATGSATRVLGHVQALVRQPSVLLASAAIVLVYFSLTGLVYRQFVEIATGVRPGLGAVIGVVAIISTLTNVPVSVNGLGLREQLHLVMFAGYGMSPEAAAGISLLLFGHLLAISAAGAALWLRTPPRKRVAP